MIYHLTDTIYRILSLFLLFLVAGLLGYEDWRAYIALLLVGGLLGLGWYWVFSKD